MLKKLRLLVLSIIFLLYTEGLLHAGTYHSFQGEDDFTPARGLLNSDVLQPLPGAAASALPSPERSTTVKNAPPPAGRRQAKVASNADRKSKKPAPPTQRGCATRAEKILRRDYHRATGLELLVTSRCRTPRGQATAMYRNFVKYGTARVTKPYRNQPAARSIAKAYEANRRNPRRAISAMTAVIASQVQDGVFISNHLRGKAVDLRAWGPQRARIKPLKQIARSRGWRVLVEPDHVHVELS